MTGSNGSMGTGSACRSSKPIVVGIEPPQPNIPTAEQIRAYLGARGSSACCPAHEDKQASLSVGEANGKVLLHCHAGCTQAAVIEALQERGVWPRSKGLTVADLALAKNLPESLLRESGFSDDEWRGLPTVRINYRGQGGQVSCVRYRGAQDKAAGSPRFWFRRGDKQQLFGLWRLRPEPVILVEGETDTVALWTSGFNALGVPGADAWREERFAQQLKDCPTIYVHVEPDGGGQKFREALERSSLNLRAKFFTVAPNAKDPCELRARDPSGFKNAIKTLLANAAAAPTARPAELRVLDSSTPVTWPAPTPLPEGLRPWRPSTLSFYRLCSAGEWKTLPSACSARRTFPLWPS